jgi:hypothetical protein
VQWWKGDTLCEDQSPTDGQRHGNNCRRPLKGGCGLPLARSAEGQSTHELQHQQRHYSSDPQLVSQLPTANCQLRWCGACVRSVSSLPATRPAQPCPANPKPIARRFSSSAWRCGHQGEGRSRSRSDVSVLYSVASRAARLNKPTFFDMFYVLVRKGTGPRKSKH